DDTEDIDPDGDGDPDDPTETLIPEDPSILAEKSAVIVDNGDGVVGLGDTINYTITLENTGNVTLTNVLPNDFLADLDGNVIGLTPVFDNATLGSLEGILLVGEIAEYTLSYTITQSDVDSGGVRNIVLAEGTSPGGTTVTDDSDDPDDTSDVDPDGDGDPDDPTETLIPEDPSISATKSATVTDVNADGVIGAGDTITYSIEVSNDGNVTLTGIMLDDILIDFDTNTLVIDPLTFLGASLGSIEGTLQVDEIATYEVIYTLTQSDIDSGGVINTVGVEGTSPTGTTVADESDDPDDLEDDDTNGDGDPDDRTETIIPELPILDTVKTANIVDNGDNVIGVGDIINYTITVTNVGNVTLDGVIIDDTITDFNGIPLNLVSGPTFDVADAGSLEGDLLVGETATYLASYTITQDDVDAGGVSNSVEAEGTSPDGTTVMDISDDGDDSDGNDQDDTTDTTTDSDFELSVIKEVDTLEPLIGDEVTFTITVSNEGLVTATGVIVEEIIPSGYAFVSAIITAGNGTYSDTSGLWTVGQLDPAEVAIMQITVEVLGFGDYLNTALISDFVGGTDQNPTNNTDTAEVDPICLTIYNEFSPNGDGVNDRFMIDCIETFPNSKLEVYNRWGNIVYSKKGYRNDWDGTSNGRAVINGSDQLPVGTYYYVIDLGDSSEPKVGWLYINR
ncbi:DUF7507 domain-containing protein, partial [Psychroserpens sp.]